MSASTPNPDPTGRSRLEVLRYTIRALNQLDRPFHADDLKKAFPEDIVTAIDSHSILLEAVTTMRGALDEIADSEGVCCQRCEGNGRLWADGKAHHPNENMPTRPCPPCDGEGRIYPDLKQIAIDAMALLDSPSLVAAVKAAGGGK